MSDLFDQLIATLLPVEGGYSNDPSDPGGETNWGITLRTARENGYTGPMLAMTQAQASDIYRRRYWTGPGLALVAPISAKVAGALFDIGVNSGVVTGVIFLQRALNVLNEQASDYPDVQADGGIGPATLAALRGLLARRGPLGETVLLRALNCLKGAHYIEIAEGRSESEKYEFGWLANRVT